MTCWCCHVGRLLLLLLLGDTSEVMVWWFILRDPKNVWRRHTGGVVTMLIMDCDAILVMTLPATPTVSPRLLGRPLHP